jgi:hypothetical protein
METEVLMAEQQYTLAQLKEFAKSKGISVSGDKKTIIRQLLAKGLLRREADILGPAGVRLGFHPLGGILIR